MRVLNLKACLVCLQPSRRHIKKTALTLLNGFFQSCLFTPAGSGTCFFTSAESQVAQSATSSAQALTAVCSLKRQDPLLCFHTLSLCGCAVYHAGPFLELQNSTSPSGATTYMPEKCPDFQLIRNPVCSTAWQTKPNSPGF